MRPVFFFLLACITSAGLLFSGCGPGPTDYYPLEVGNRWVFETHSFVDNTVQSNQELIVRREGTTYTFDNGEVVMNVSLNSLVNKDGLVLLRSPVEKGAQWVDMNVKVQITAMNETYTVPAGTFDQTLETTWEMKRADPEDPNKIFTDVTVNRYAKGVGPIYYYYEVIDPDGKKTAIFKSELIKHENVKNKQ